VSKFLGKFKPSDENDDYSSDYYHKKQKMKKEQQLRNRKHSKDSFQNENSWDDNTDKHYRR
jgi:hypothetical protein